MRITKVIVILALCLINVICCFPQSSGSRAPDSLRISGQLSLRAGYNHNADLPISTGGRYIPSANYSIMFPGRKLLDFEVSANIYGTYSFNLYETGSSNSSISPYRGWIRYSSEQLELRAGLQKINFGSASLLRPLMWFDQMDSRDPLNLTDGVWGLLLRYYFLNNANIWLWGLYGNDAPRGFELIPVNRNIPEFGGRVQVPVSRGEAAISYHHRKADNTGMMIFPEQSPEIPENRLGFDAKLDLKAGIWIEGSWTRKKKNLGRFTNQEILNAGIDYTFGIGNGLYMAYEHLMISWDEKPFAFSDKTSFSLVTINYPAGLFDRLSAIVYYNWTENRTYNFVSWQRQFDKTMFYLMLYWNPETGQLPAQTGSENLYAGKGIQLMFVFNH